MVTFTNRVGSFSQTSFLTSNLSRMQKDSATLQAQLHTQLKSQDYAGLGLDTFRLVNMENQVTKLDTYYKTNKESQTSLKLMDNSITQINDELLQARTAIGAYASLNVSNPPTASQEAARKNAQKVAFNVMQGIAEYLNASNDGNNYLFSGGKTDTPPVNFPYRNLEDFQKTWDGALLTYPQSRSANLNNFRSTGNIEFLDTAGATATAGLTVAAGQGAIKEVNPGDFLDPLTLGVQPPLPVPPPANLDKIILTTPAQAGDVLKISDGTTSYTVTVDRVESNGTDVYFKREPKVPATFVPTSVDKVNVPNGLLGVTDAGGNSGQYRVLDVQTDAGGATYLIVDPPPQASGTMTNATMERQIYYQGDDLQLSYNLSENRSIDVGVNAKDAAFEKAFRSLALVAQGGLDDNPARAQEAMKLLADALQHDPSWTSEQSSDIKQVGTIISLNNATIQTTVEFQEMTINFLKSASSEIRDIKKEDVSAQLLSLQTQIQVAYSAFSITSQMSLADYF